MAAAVVKEREMWYNTQKRQLPPARVRASSPRWRSAGAIYLRTIEERGKHE